jgi:hypothetical protein
VGQRRDVILPEIQELASQGLQLCLHLILHRGRWGGLLRVGGHDSSAFPAIIGVESGVSQCSYCIAK